jgi:hypothetical protein
MDRDWSSDVCSSDLTVPLRDEIDTAGCIRLKSYSLPSFRKEQHSHIKIL